MKKIKSVWFVGLALLLIGGSHLLTVDFPDSLVKNTAASSELDKETEKAREVHAATAGFLETYANVEQASASEEEFFATREALSQFITENLLDKLYPNMEEIEEMYGREEFFAEDPSVPKQRYSRELIDAQLFIDYDTLDDKKVFVIAYITVEEIMGDFTSLNEERVTLRLEKEEGKWLVDGFMTKYL